MSDVNVWGVNEMVGQCLGVKKSMSGVNKQGGKYLGVISKCFR